MKRLSILLLFCVALIGALASPSVVRAQHQTLLTGTLLGHDGKPMPRAHVHLFRPNQPKPIASVEASRDGSFRVSTRETGVILVRFTGVNHRGHEVPLYSEPPAKVSLVVRLRANEYATDFSDVKVIGDFNNFSAPSAKPMQKQPDGTYAAEFESGAAKFSYQLLGVTSNGSSVNGTQSEDYVYDGGGDYRSVVTPKGGTVRIIFDPRRLVRSETPASARFADTHSKAARFALIYTDMLARRRSFSAAFAAHKKAGKPAYDFRYDWAADLADLSTRVAKEKEPPLRQLLLFSYLDLGYGAYGARLDPGVAQKALAEIPATSFLWSLEPDLLGVALGNSGRPEQYAGYVQHLIAEHPDPRMRKVAEKEFAPGRSIMVGKMVPPFSLASLDDPETTFTDTNLRGKVYLIDFWATWCKPCVEEMENMHRAYKKYAGRGFVILSLSLDDKVEVVRRFRDGRWKMPWLNSHIAGGFDNEIVKRFEITGIPKPILVDRAGKIVATRNELRGPNLDQTLARVLGGEK